MKRNFLYALVFSTAVAIPMAANAAPNDGPAAGTAPGTQMGDHPPTEASRLGDQSMTPMDSSVTTTRETERRGFFPRSDRRDMTSRGGVEKPLNAPAGTADPNSLYPSD